jgi:carboxyl-terminal processing protease
MIIDLRGNPGGAGGMAMGVAGHVMDEPKSLGAMRTRDTTLEFKVNPRRSTPQGERVEPFSGPVAIVVDPLSASTSEIFAGGLQKLGRARVFGRTSAGAALPAQMKSLPSGDALLFAFANFTLPDGSTIEGVGVIADEPRGAHGFGYDPHLWIPERAMTSAELSPEEKNAMSHRGRAVRRLAYLLFHKRISW